MPWNRIPLVCEQQTDTNIGDVHIVKVATRSEPVIISISSSSSSDDNSEDEYGPRLPPSLRAGHTSSTSSKGTRHERDRRHDESDLTFSENECDRHNVDSRRSKKKDKRKKKKRKKSRKHKRHKR